MLIVNYTTVLCSPIEPRFEFTSAVNDSENADVVLFDAIDDHVFTHSKAA
jgi:hypothetical protein